MKENLKSRTISGMLWSFTDLIVNQGFAFVIQIFLARILEPSDFGIIGMITIFIAVATVIVDGGFGNALIREKEVSKEDYSTVFFINAIAAGALYFVLFYSAPFFADFFNEPQVSLLLRVLSIVLIINVFGFVQRISLIRKIDFKTQTKINLISSIISGFAAIYLAMENFGVWALVFRIIIMQGIQSILLCVYCGWMTTLKFSFQSFEKFFSFGWKILLANVSDTLYQNIYYIVIGKFFSVNELGYYTNSKKISDCASQIIVTTVQKVSYPALSAVKEDKAQLYESYKKIIRGTMFISFPLMIGLSAMGEPIILMLFGEKWGMSVIYFQILCITGTLYPLHAINLNILQVVGRSDLFLLLEIIKKAIIAFNIFFVILVGGKIYVLLWSGVLLSVICCFVNSYFSDTIISYSWKMQLQDIFPSFMAATLMGFSTFYIGGFIQYNNFIKIIVESIFSMVAFVVFAKICHVKELDDLWGMVVKIYGSYSK